MKRWLSVSAMVVLATASCGGSSSEQASGDEPPPEAQAPDAGETISASWQSDPCSLISDAEMSDMLPSPVSGQIVNTFLCEYGPADLDLGRVDIELFVQDVAATGCDLFYDVGGFGSAVPVNGVGTSARWKGESGIKQLGVCVDDDVVLTITVYDPDGTTDPLAAATAVGELAVARL